MLLLRKDKEWGEFVDVGKDEAIVDHSVVTVVLDILPEVQVGYSVGTHCRTAWRITIGILHVLRGIFRATREFHD